MLPGSVSPPFIFLFSALTQLTAGDPDDVTQSLLAQLICDIMKVTSDGFLARFPKNNLSIYGDNTAEPPVTPSAPGNRLSDMMGQFWTMLSTVSADDISNKGNRQRPSDRSTQPPISSNDSFVMKTSKIAETIIQKNKKKMSEDFLHQVLDMENHLLQAESSKELLAVADDITEFIVGEIKSLRKADSAGPSPDNKGKSTINMDRVTSKVKKFFAKQFATAFIHRTVALAKAKLHLVSTAESRKSFEALMADVDSMLKTEFGDITQPGVEQERIQFPLQLSGLLYRHITLLMAQSLMSADTAGTTAAPETDSGICINMLVDIHNLLGVMSYFIYTSIISCTSSVVQTLEYLLPEHSSSSPLGSSRIALELESQPKPKPAVSEPEAGSAVDTSAVSHRDTTKQAEDKSTFVHKLVEKLIYRTFRKAGRTDPEQMEAIIQRVFVKTYAEVEDVDFKPGSKKFDTLEKDILRDLVKRCGTLHNVLTFMCLKDSGIESSIAFKFKCYLSRPKGNSVSRFFSSVC